MGACGSKGVKQEVLEAARQEAEAARADAKSAQAEAEAARRAAAARITAAGSATEHRRGGLVMVILTPRSPPPPPSRRLIRPRLGHFRCRGGVTSLALWRALLLSEPAAASRHGRVRALKVRPLSAQAASGSTRRWPPLWPKSRAASRGLRWRPSPTLRCGTSSRDARCGRCACLSARHGNRRCSRRHCETRCCSTRRQSRRVCWWWTRAPLAIHCCRCSAPPSLRSSRCASLCTSCFYQRRLSLSQRSTCSAGYAHRACSPTRGMQLSSGPRYCSLQPRRRSASPCCCTMDCPR
mmetsp:Transcript_21412/g.70204  ORF Transcript_21412/g.70204 Transcript_21412/m.70204 type:complete len:295 (+) Transcript_21412:77-961(+)